MYHVPSFPHLRGIELQVRYMELRTPQPKDTPDAELKPLVIEHKWKQDPDYAGQPFAPKPKYYKDGELFRKGEPQQSRILRDPPPLDTNPRREGIVRVYEGDPDYEEECRKKGLFDRIPGYEASPSASGLPRQVNSNRQPEQLNGITPPRSDKSINGGSPHLGSVSEAHASQLPNGTNSGDAGPSDTFT